MSVHDIAAKIIGHSPWTVWRMLVSSVETQTAILDAIIGPNEHANFRAFGDGFELKRGGIAVIVKRSAAGVTWTRIVQTAVDQIPTKTTGHLELLNDGYLLYGSSFSSMEETALFLLDKLT